MFIKEFFGIGGHTRIPEGAWSWQHVSFVCLMLAAMVLLAVYFGKSNRNKDLTAKNKVLIWTALLIDGFELMKIVVNCIDDGFGAMRRMLPLFLCSIQLIGILQRKAERSLFRLRDDVWHFRRSFRHDRRNAKL